MNKEKIQLLLEAEACKKNGGMCESYEYCKFCEQPKKINRTSNTPCADAYMNLKDITKQLNNYQENKEYIKTSSDRINLWKIALNSKKEEDLWILFDTSEPIDLGMPRAKNKISSPIESELNKREITREMVKVWINREEEKLNCIKRDVYKLEDIFKVLKEEEMFLIECKYFDKLKYSDIEVSYENEFKKCINNDALRKKLLRIKEKIRNLQKK